MSHRFQSQVDVISFDLGFYIFSKTRLKIFLEDKLLSVIKAKVTSQKIVMVMADQLGSNDL